MGAVDSALDDREIRDISWLEEEVEVVVVDRACARATSPKTLTFVSLRSAAFFLPQDFE